MPIANGPVPWTSDELDEWIADELQRAPVAADDPEACRRIVRALMSAQSDTESV